MRLCRLRSSDDVFTAAMFCLLLLESPCSLFLSLPCRQTGFHDRLMLPVVFLTQHHAKLGKRNKKVVHSSCWTPVTGSGLTQSFLSFCLDLFFQRSVLPLSACVWVRLPAAAHLPDYPHLPWITLCLNASWIFQVKPDCHQNGSLNCRFTPLCFQCFGETAITAEQHEQCTEQEHRNKLPLHLTMINKKGRFNNKLKKAVLGKEVSF